MITLFSWNIYHAPESKVIASINFNSNPHHHWVEHAKELNEVWHMIINNAGQKYNHKTHATLIS